MKSVVMSFYQLQSAVSSALNFALTPVNVEYRFAWLFGSFAVTAVVIGTIFMFLFRHLDEQERELNAIGTGERKGFAGEEEAAERKA
jgi:POT family proton-dependent oligopeptide transporter